MIMRKHIGSFVVLFVLFALIAGCATIGEVDRDDYGLLGSAATSCASAAIGVYGDVIPGDLTSEKLLSVCKNQIPPNYFAALAKYPSDVKPKGSYYLLLIYDLDKKGLIMFHYSCSPQPGRVLANPGKYDVSNIELYDSCKGNKW